MEVIKIKLLNNSWVDILLCLRDGEIPFESERGPRAVCFLFLVARLLPALPVWGLGGCLVFPVLGSPQQQPGPGSDHWPPLLVAGGGRVSLSLTSPSDHSHQQNWAQISTKNSRDFHPLLQSFIQIFSSVTPWRGEDHEAGEYLRQKNFNIQ